MSKNFFGATGSVSAVGTTTPESSAKQYSIEEMESLRDALKQSLKTDAVSPVLLDDQFVAIDRRVSLILQVRPTTKIQLGTIVQNSRDYFFRR